MILMVEVFFIEVNELVCEKFDKCFEIGNSYDCYFVWWNEFEDKDLENFLNWFNGWKWGIIGIFLLLIFLMYV